MHIVMYIACQLIQTFNQIFAWIKSQLYTLYLQLYVYIQINYID